MHINKIMHGPQTLKMSQSSKWTFLGIEFLWDYLQSSLCLIYVNLQINTQSFFKEKLLEGIFSLFFFCCFSNYTQHYTSILYTVNVCI